MSERDSGGWNNGSSQIATMMSITDEEFGRIRSLVYSKFGINLTEQKRSLVVGRLQKLVRQRGMHSFQEYITYVMGDTSGEALDTLVNRISTNHTFFFREKEHFNFLQQVVLPEITGCIGSAKKDFRLWCAACSSGEEAYGLMMTLIEYFGSAFSQWDAGILATDISANVLGIAKRGVYPSDRVKDVPASVKSKFFRKKSEEEWEVSERLRNEVTFRRLNLMNKQFPFKRKFHVIFCRNVMIYFDQETRESLVQRFYDSLEPGGYLFIGHSETIRRESSRFNYVRPAVYRKPEG